MSEAYDARMPTTIYSCAARGLTCELVEVEVNISDGMHKFTIVGLRNTAVQDAR